MRVLVVMPTYEEADSLPGVLQRLRTSEPDVDVLVVDDASPDGTGELAEQVAATDPGVHVMHRSGKAGLGVAYRAGFAWGLERGYDVLVEMDADGSHLPEELGSLVEAARTADLVIGSRWVAGGSVVNWPWYRRLISRGGTLYARIALGLPVHDATAGFRAFRADTLRRIDVAGVASQGYCFQIDMTRRVHEAGLQVVEVPVTFVERELGTSKMSSSIVREALWRVTVWGLARLVPGHRRRAQRITPGHGETPAPGRGLGSSSDAGREPR
ncbi:dolichol-phosphate mannosyltransferase [Aeromicrobium sp. SORGH_AS981]|nr:polyprenol monophosphomannose synthase [Aeromicrobium sp. SORGH_AS_0981]MDR6119514.1 dolichol-phosphate mannosyltransferase [Aeromicrobium sp. SORGH_AS_0981]